MDKFECTKLLKTQKNKLQKPNRCRITLPAVTLLLALIFFPVVSAVFLTACGNTEKTHATSGSLSPDFLPHSGLNSDLPLHNSLNPDDPLRDSLNPDAPSQNGYAQDNVSRDASPFHSVPYFHDDTRRSAQTLDGYLYGYWGGQLCRYALDTLSRKEYFRANSNQSGQFCIYEDYIYFLERPHTASLTGVDTCLYQVGLDGRGRKLLTTQVPNTTVEYSGLNNYSDYYEIDIYDDIIYLLSDNFGENIYYRLDRKWNSVKRIEESETLYGMLPEGYKAPIWYSHIPSLPYQMRHYGYLILMDEKENLAAYDVESGRLEKIILPSNNIASKSVFLTNDALYCAEKAEAYQPLVTWYRISLDDLHNVEEWGQFLPMQSYFGNDIFYDETGAYFAKREDSTVVLYKILWDGGGITMLCSYYLEGGDYIAVPAYGDRYLSYTDGNYFYFNDKKGTDKKGSQCCVMRKSLHETSRQAETVAVYYEYPAEDICNYDTLEHTFSVDAEIDGEVCTFSYYTSLTKVLLTEKTEGALVINAYLDKVYDELRQELDSFETSYKDEFFFPLPDGPGSHMRVTAYPDCLDERYIGITVVGESYFSGAAHPYTYSRKYVFDRRTGKRIAVTDIVENSPEEICSIAAAYIDRDHPGSHFAKNREVRESILEDFRFFLSKEGIGFHFDTYELGSYAEGDEDYIIPFWEFDLKKDTVNYIDIEKVPYMYFNAQLEEGKTPSFVEALEGILSEQLREGTLSAFLEEHASDYRELSFEEILEQIAADEHGVLKQYYTSAKQPGDKWLYFENSQSIWIQQSYLYEGSPRWRYYRFPHVRSGYGCALDADSSSEEFYFLAWEGTDYLVTTNRNANGEINTISTHCLLDDTIYNGWILRQTLEGNGEVTSKCLFYWM